jgi:hypothetical protein
MQLMQSIPVDLSLSAAGSDALNFQDRLDLVAIMPLFRDTMFCYVSPLYWPYWLCA